MVREGLKATLIIIFIIMVCWLAGMWHNAHLKNEALRLDNSIYQTAFKETREANRNLESIVEANQRYIKELEDTISMYVELPAYNLVLRNDPVDMLVEVDVKLERILEAKKFFPIGNPLHQPYRITSYFGDDVLEHEMRVHMGIDLIPANLHTQSIDVYAVQPGTVSGIGFDRIYGKWVLIDHEGGYQTFYAHLSKIFYTADIGKIVNTSTRVGIMGSTGQVSGKTGIHLHYEIRYLNPDTGLFEKINPYPFLKEGNQ